MIEFIGILLWFFLKYGGLVLSGLSLTIIMLSILINQYDDLGICVLSSWIGMGFGYVFKSWLSFYLNLSVFIIMLYIYKYKIVKR